MGRTLKMKVSATNSALNLLSELQNKYGEIKSKQASKAALERMKEEGKKAMVKVFKPKKSGFKLQPKAGTKAYKKLITKM